MNRKGLSVVEILVVLAIVGILAAILLPALSKRQPPRRHACVNNLKQLGLVLNLYAHENGDKFPPIDNLKNNFMFESDLLYPEYLSDAQIAACPMDPETNPNTNFRLIADHPDGTDVGVVHPDCITNMSYLYLGWMVITDKEAEAFFNAYDSEMSPEDRDNDLTVPEGSGNAEGDTLHRLSAGVHQFLLTSANAIYTSDELDSGVVPIIWDQISTNIAEFNHVPAGQNVLYLDGHVDFHRYDLNATEFPLSPMTAAQFGGRPRAPVPNCEE